MGKCGGRELNYVSDVDVIFVAEPVDPSDAESAGAGARATQVAAAPDADLRPGRLAGRRRAAARGQGRPAGAHPGQPPGLLPAVGPHLGVPGAAQGPPGRRRPGPRARPTSTRSRRWSGRPPSGPGFVADVRAMRRRVEATSRRRRPTGRSSSGRGGLRDVEFAVQLLQLVHGRADETLRVGGTLPALRALSRGGYVGRDDGEPGRRLPLPAHRRAPAAAAAAAAHPPACPTDRAALRWLARSLGYRPDARGDAVEVLRGRAGRCTPARYAGCTRSCSTGRCWRRWPGCRPRRCGSPAEARRRLAGGPRLRRPGRRAAAHRGADRRGVAGRRRSSGPCCRCCCRVRRRARTRTAACSPTGRCPTSSARTRGTCGCCATRARSPSGWPGCSAPAGTSPTLLDAGAGGAAAAGRRRRAAAAPARRRWRARGGRRPPGAPDPQPTASRVLRGLRRQELFRIACADLLGRLDVVRVGHGAHRHRRGHPGGGAGRRRRASTPPRPGSTSPRSRWTSR